MNNYDVKCRIIEEELKTFWPQWHVIRRLGGGAFGDVFEIYRDNFGIREKSALKMIQISDEPATMALIQPVGEAVSPAQDGQTVIPEAFRNEIQIMEALRGAPNIVTIEDFYLKRDASSTMLFVRMELLTSFQQMMAERQRDQQPFTIPEILKIGRDICTALMFCEKKGIIHRDIKPANLFVDGFGCFKVGDFGVSRRMDTVHVALTMTGIGTISYMAPEVYKGASYKNTVDIYALGLILYQLLNNCRVPFLPTEGSYTTKDIDSANYRRLHGEPLPSLTGTRIGNETVDASLDSMIRKACAIRSEDRYQSAKAFYEDLAVWGTPLAKKLQEDIPQKQQQEKTSQIISQKHSSLSERKSQNKNPPPDQTAHLLFTDNAQEEYTDTSRDIDRNTRTEQTTGLNMPGIGDSHIPGAKDDDKADSKQQRSGRSRIINYAIVFALVGVLIWLGYSLIGGIKQTAHSSSSSSSIASTDEAAESAILASTYEEGDAVITLSTAEFAVLAAASTAEYAETASFDTTYEEAEGDISDTQEEIATSEAIKDTISDSWDEIIAAGEDGSYIEKYHIGDTKELDLGEEGVIRMELVALDTDELADGSGKAHMTWIAKNVLTSYHCMNEYYNEGSGERGWPDSDMRTWLRENIFPLIPDNVELNIKEVTKYSYSFCDGGTISSHDLIWIPSVREVSEKEDFFGGKQCYEDYGPQYISAFSDDESRQKYLIGTSYPAWWWLRSAGSDYRFDLFHSDDYDDYCNDDGEGGVVIGFCL